MIIIKEKLPSKPKDNQENKEKQQKWKKLEKQKKQKSLVKVNKMIRIQITMKNLKSKVLGVRVTMEMRRQKKEIVEED